MISVQTFGKGGNENGGVVYTGARGKGEGIIKMFDYYKRITLVFQSHYINITEAKFPNVLASGLGIRL